MAEQPQAIEGYGCQCGYQTDDINKLRKHLLDGGRADGKGFHKSVGRVNLSTGEVILPPWTERTKEQQEMTRRAARSKDRPLTPEKKTPSTPIIKNTDNFYEATELRLVPRVYTITLTPIMITGYEIAQRKWGWRRGMPLENFLDTVIYNYCAEHDSIIHTWSSATDISLQNIDQFKSVEEIKDYLKNKAEEEGNGSRAGAHPTEDEGDRSKDGDEAGILLGGPSAGGPSKEGVPGGSTNGRQDNQPAAGSGTAV